MVVVRDQFRLKRLKKYGLAFDGFHGTHLTIRRVRPTQVPG
jgi:hypothetical protein